MKNIAKLKTQFIYELRHYKHILGHLKHNLEENGNKCKMSASDPVMEWKCRITCAAEADRKCQQGKLGEDVEMKVEAIVETPFVKGNAETRFRLTGLKRQESVG